MKDLWHGLRRMTSGGPGHWRKKLWVGLGWFGPSFGPTPTKRLWFPVLRPPTSMAIMKKFCSVASGGIRGMWVPSDAWHRGLRVRLSGLSLKLRPQICAPSGTKHFRVCPSFDLWRYQCGADASCVPSILIYPRVNFNMIQVEIAETSVGCTAGPDFPRNSCWSSFQGDPAAPYFCSPLLLEAALVSISCSAYYLFGLPKPWNSRCQNLYTNWNSLE